MQHTMIEPTESELDEIYDQIDKYLRHVSRCGWKEKVGNKVITRKCKKDMCSKCGKRKGVIHKDRHDAILKKVGRCHETALHLEFKLPNGLNRRFMSKYMLNRWVDIIKGVIKQAFGQPYENILFLDDTQSGYYLEHCVVSTIKLFTRDGEFSPIINVVIFNPPYIEHVIEFIEDMHSIDLRVLLQEYIQSVNVEYNIYSKDGIDNLIWLINEPENPNIIKKTYIDIDSALSVFMFIGMKHSKKIRYWGRCRNLQLVSGQDS